MTLTDEDGEEENRDGDVENWGGDVKEPVRSHGEESQEKQEEEKATFVLFTLREKQKGFRGRKIRRGRKDLL